MGNKTIHLVSIHNIGRKNKFKYNFPQSTSITFINYRQHIPKIQILQPRVCKEFSILLGTQTLLPFCFIENGTPPIKICFSQSIQLKITTDNTVLAKAFQSYLQQKHSLSFTLTSTQKTQSFTLFLKHEACVSIFIKNRPVLKYFYHTLNKVFRPLQLNIKKKYVHL